MYPSGKIYNYPLTYLTSHSIIEHYFLLPITVNPLYLSIRPYILTHQIQSNHAVISIREYHLKALINPGWTLRRSITCFFFSSLFLIFVLFITLFLFIMVYFLMLLLLFFFILGRTSSTLSIFLFTILFLHSFHLCLHKCSFLWCKPTEIIPWLIIQGLWISYFFACLFRSSTGSIIPQTL